MLGRLQNVLLANKCLAGSLELLTDFNDAFVLVVDQFVLALS